jgi:hypothetical protein
MPTLSKGSTLTFVATQPGETIAFATNGGIATITGAASFIMGPLPVRRTVGPLAVGDTVTVVANSADVIYLDSVVSVSRFDVSGTWATVNASATKSNVGAIAYVSDWRAQMVSDGTNWRPFPAVTLASVWGTNGTPLTSTTGGANAIFPSANVAIPAGLLCANVVIRGRAVVQRGAATNATGDLVMRLGTAGSVSDSKLSIITVPATTNIFASLDAQGAFAASTTQYFSQGNMVAMGTSTSVDVATQTTNVNTAAAMTLSVGMSSMNASDTFNLIGYSVWIE